MACDGIDIGIPLRNGMPHWRDNPPLQINRTMDFDCGDEATVSSIAIGSHTGTHMDAPLHFIKTGRAIHEVPLTATIGRAQVIEIHHPDAITLEELRRPVVRPGVRLLFKTKNSLRRWGKRDFMQDCVCLTTEAARWSCSSLCGRWASIIRRSAATRKTGLRSTACCWEPIPGSSRVSIFPAWDPVATI